jgi:hypothetical protein
MLQRQTQPLKSLPAGLTPQKRRSYSDGVARSPFGLADLGVAPHSQSRQPSGMVTRRTIAPVKKLQPRRGVPALRVTAAMKRAGTEVLNGAPEMYSEELVAEIYKAMVVAGGMVGNG